MFSWVTTYHANPTYASNLYPCPEGSESGRGGVVGGFLLPERDPLPPVRRGSRRGPTGWQFATSLSPVAIRFVNWSTRTSLPRHGRGMPGRRRPKIWFWPKRR